jgi:hypothetical protein
LEQVEEERRLAVSMCLDLKEQLRDQKAAPAATNTNAPVL